MLSRCLRAAGPTLARSRAALVALCSVASEGPATPRDVLNFWFGAGWDAGGMDAPGYTGERVAMWFRRSDSVDAEARTFSKLIRAAGRNELHGIEWDARDGLVARLVLCDQLSRNAFRGTAEAYAYDDGALIAATELVELVGEAPHALPGPMALFVVTCLMHSEEIAMHERASIFATRHVEISSSPFLQRQLDVDLPSHTEVLRRFGRYPHRNAHFGRETTDAERAWLDSEECPGWAKSQQSF